MARSLLAVLVAVLALSTAPAHAASDVRIQYAALQRLLGEQAFTAEGRRYVKGGPAAKCNFAYLEHPLVGAAGGRLLVRARFTGRSALNVFGACVGMGDSFDLLISARPEYRDGAIRLAEVQVTTAARGFYAGRVCRAMAQSLPQQFAYPVEDEARRAIEEAAAPGYPRHVTRFDVRHVAVTADALVLSVDLEITVG